MKRSRPAAVRKRALPATAVRGMVDDHRKLVTRLAARYHAQFPAIPFDELVAEGDRGLVEAARRYDPRHRAKFSTYAWFWILKNITAYISSAVGVIDVPRSVAADVRRISVAMSAALKSGKDASPAAVARAVGMRPDDVRALLQERSVVGRVVSIDRFLDDDEQTQTIADVLTDPRERSMAGRLEAAGSAEEVRAMLGRLLPAERAVMELRYGIRGGAAVSVRDVARRLKLTASRVRDIETIARLKLKRLLREEDDHA